MNIIFIGFKNCGKTTVGQTLAKKVHCQFLDTDLLLQNLYNIENNTDFSVPEIYRQEGEVEFRNWEARVITSLQEIDNTIISTGGGIVLHPDNIPTLKKMGKVVYLQVSSEELLKRQKMTRVPSFLAEQNPQDSFMQMYTFREPLYIAAADYIIDVNYQHTAEVVEELLLKVL